MHYRRLGSSDFDVSVLALGAWQFGDPSYWGDTPEKKIQATVDRALDAGINLFDTAEMYGNGESERALGKALGSRRDDVFIASKVVPEHCAPGALRKACENSLRRLNTSAIDLYQVHWPIRDTPIGEVYGVLERLRDEGKVRAAGVSNFGVQDLTEWCDVGDCVSNQLGYNLLFRAVEWDILPACRAKGVGVLAYMPLMQGLLSGRWTVPDEVPTQRRRTRHFSRDRDGTRHGEAGCETETFQALDGLRKIADDLGQSNGNSRAGVASCKAGRHVDRRRRPESGTGVAQSCRRRVDTRSERRSTSWTESQTP